MARQKFQIGEKVKVVKLVDSDPEIKSNYKRHIGRMGTVIDYDSSECPYHIQFGDNESGSFKVNELSYPSKLDKALL